MQIFLTNFSTLIHNIFASQFVHKLGQSLISEVNIWSPTVVYLVKKFIFEDLMTNILFDTLFNMIMFEGETLLSDCLLEIEVDLSKEKWFLTVTVLVDDVKIPQYISSISTLIFQGLHIKLFSLEIWGKESFLWLFILVTALRLC